ncbi:MAG: alpha/beta hydrolase [Planctomycetota bacterium]
MTPAARRERGRLGPRAARAAAVVALLLAGAGVASGRGDAPSKGAPAAPPPVEGQQTVELVAVDNMKLAATYAANGAKEGSPALVLVHGEGEVRGSFAPLHRALAEHRVPWLALDLRGYGDSRKGAGDDLGPRAAAGDATLQASMSDDVWAAVRWLVDVKKHDRARIGIMASKLGASAALKAAREHKGDVAWLALLTPATTYAGLDTVADTKDQHGPMELWFFSSVDDMNVLEKKGPRHLLYVAEHARNAPSGTPFDERIKRRRGVPPHLRAFRETGIPGTAMFAGVAQLDVWLAGFWARALSTYPHPVLFDGSVDVKGDYADTEWASGTELRDGAGSTCRVLRWGRRVMVGGALPKDATSIRLRVHGTRGDRQRAGQFARIDYPSGMVTSAPIVRGFGRAPPTDCTALVLQPEEIPQKDGSIEYGDPSFEVEFRLPEVGGTGPYEIRIAFALTRGGRDPVDAPGYDENDPKTWTLLPDLLEGTGIPYLPPTDGAPAGDAGRDTPDGPLDPK